MACYLRTITEPAECGACSDQIEPGQVVFTDEIERDGVPVCDTCAAGLDSTLAATVQAMRKLGDSLAE